MRVINQILRLVGWLFTLALQITASFFIIFLFSVVFSGVDTTSRLSWLFLLFFIWLGYVLGINLVGYIFLRWLWNIKQLLTIQRLAGTMIAALVPLVVLLPIGYSIPVGDAGTRFYDLVVNTWQPILAQAALFTGILGYYIPSAFKRKEIQSPSVNKLE